MTYSLAISRNTFCQPVSSPARKEAPSSGGALADALRRAGVTADKNGVNRTKPR